MQRLFPILIIVGVMVWGFLLWQHFQPVRQVEKITEQVNDADTADRCAKYRMNDGEDTSTWSLGYSGRIRQLVHGCF